MKFAVVRFPGSNCDDDAMRVVCDVLRDDGSSGEIAWHKSDGLPANTDAVIVPGGFSYGDYLRAGAMAAASPIMNSVVKFANSGGPVLGICNGFQILCESGLLEGALVKNSGLKFVCKDVWLRVEGRPTPFTSKIAAGDVLRMSIAHSEGRYCHPDIESLEKQGQVVFRYSTKQGEVTDAVNPNGTTNSIAGVCNAQGNVLGLMPHPERACENILGGGGEDGLSMFRSALSHLRGGTAK